MENYEKHTMLPKLDITPQQIKTGSWKCTSIVKISTRVFEPGERVELIEAGIEDLTGSVIVTIQWNGTPFTTYYNYFRKYFIWMN